jgi:hypothetical protein
MRHAEAWEGGVCLTGRFRRCVRAKPFDGARDPALFGIWQLPEPFSKLHGLHCMGFTVGAK